MFHVLALIGIVIAPPADFASGLPPGPSRISAMGVWRSSAVAAGILQAPFVDLCGRPGDPCRLGKPHSFQDTIDQLPDLTRTPLRIAILVAQKNVQVGGKGRWFHVLNGQPQPVNLGEHIHLTLQKGKLAGRYEGILRFEPTPGTASWIGNRPYRGAIEVVPDSVVPGTVNAINLVMIDDYLKGVLPSEMIPDWELEALKAQAIAARSYAIANYGRRRDRGFDLFATVADQVYGGLKAEKPHTNQAVDETRWQIMTYQNRPVSAYFHASAGGMTDHIEKIWGFDAPYIRPRQDYDQAAPKAHWRKLVPKFVLERALAPFKLGIGKLQQIRVASYTPGGRADHVLIQGSQSAVHIDAKVLRFALGLNSTKFDVWKDKAGVFHFQGEGWGHGLGLSQWGARQMAKDGKSAHDILLHYYTGVSIQTLSPRP